MADRDTTTSTSAPSTSETTAAPAETSAPSTTTSTTSTTTEPPPPDIRSVDLNAGTWQVLCPSAAGPVEVRHDGGSFRSVDGAGLVESFEPTYGDITGDGREDAVVATVCVFPDSANVSAASIFVVTSERDGPRQAGPPVEGSHPEVRGPGVVVTRYEHLDGDPSCCPSNTRHVPLTFQGDGLAPGGGGDPIGDGSVATTTGLGGFAVGRSYGEIAAATGQPVLVESVTPGDDFCVYVTVEGGPANVHGLGDGAGLRSVEIGNPAIRTTSGLGLGSTEADIHSAFPGQVTEEPHVYLPGGKYLTFTPQDSPDHVAVFDTDAGAVVHYRVGEPAWAGAVEGCL